MTEYRASHRHTHRHSALRIPCLMFRRSIPPRMTAVTRCQATTGHKTGPHNISIVPLFVTRLYSRTRGIGNGAHQNTGYVTHRISKDSRRGTVWDDDSGTAKRTAMRGETGGGMALPPALPNPLVFGTLLTVYAIGVLSARCRHNAQLPQHPQVVAGRPLLRRVGRSRPVPGRTRGRPATRRAGGGPRWRTSAQSPASARSPPPRVAGGG